MRGLKMNKILERFNELLVEKNKVVNLTAHKTLESSWSNNIQDSLLFVDEFNKTGKVLDLGSGCGCPAIPLKIVLNDLDVTMLDSVRKKTDFLNEAVTELGLASIRAVHTRIEDFVDAKAADKVSSREGFDIVTARAVAELPTLLEYSLPFLKVGGRLFAFKGKNYQTEIDLSSNALKILGGEVERVVSKVLVEEKSEGGESLGDIERFLVIIKKIRKTPEKYPRGKNLPRLKPL